MKAAAIILTAMLGAAAQPAAALDAFGAVRLGMNLYDTTLNSAGGARFVDQGGDAIRFDAVVGLDWRLPRGFVIGMEGSVGGTSGRSRLMVPGTVFAWQTPFIGEAAARLGWRAESGAGVYLRLGAAVGLVEQSLNGRSRDGWNGGLMVGATGEIPIGTGSPVFARIDVSHTQIGAMEVWTGTAGVGYRW